MLKLSGTNVIVNSSGQPIDCSTCPCSTVAADPCQEFIDDFNRSDSTDLGSNWVEVSGDGRIASNTLQFSTPDSLVYTSSNHQAEVIEVTVRGNSAGDKARIFYSSTAGLSYGMEIEFGTNVARAYRNASGSITVVHECPITVATNTDISLKLTQSPTFRGWINDAEVVSFDETFSVDSNTGFPGAGTGDTVAGTITFDNFEMSDQFESNSNCPQYNIGCWPVDNFPPSEITLVISGVTGGSSPLNGTYGLDAVLPAGIGSREWRTTGININIGSGTTVTELAVGVDLQIGGLHFDCEVNSEILPEFNGSWVHDRDSTSNSTDGCNGANLVLTSRDTTPRFSGSLWTLSY